jgi:hypothetical protein
MSLIMLLEMLLNNTFKSIGAISHRAELTESFGIGCWGEEEGDSKTQRGEVKLPPRDTKTLNCPENVFFYYLCD